MPEASIKSRGYPGLVQVILLEMLVLFYFLLVRAISERPLAADFSKLYTSVQYFRKGENIYAPVPVDHFGPVPEDVELTRDILLPNLNLPVITLLLVPLGNLEYRTAYMIWSLLSLLCGLAAVALVGFSTTDQENRMRRAFTLAILLLAFFPTVAAFQLGQTSMALLLLLSITWVAARTGKDEVAGVALGLAVTLTLFVGLLVFFFLIRQRWRLVSFCAITFLLGTIAGLLVFGFPAHREFLQILRSVDWYAMSWNASLLGLFTRIFADSQNAPPASTPWVAYALSLGLSLLVLVAFTWLLWPRDDEPEPEVFDLGFGLSLTLMLLISPLGWMYYFPILLIVVVAAWGVSDKMLLGRYKWALVAFWLLSTVPSRLTPAADFSQPLRWFGSVGGYSYALVILAVLLGIMIVRLRKGQRHHPILNATP